MSEGDGRPFPEDMLESIGNIAHYTKGVSFQNFLKDRRTQDALVRNLEVLGVSIPFTVAQSDRTNLAASLMGPFPLASRQTISSQRAALLAGASEIKVAIFAALAHGSSSALRRPRSS